MGIHGSTTASRSPIEVGSESDRLGIAGEPSEKLSLKSTVQRPNPCVLLRNCVFISLDWNTHRTLMRLAFNRIPMIVSGNGCAAGRKHSRFEEIDHWGFSDLLPHCRIQNKRRKATQSEVLSIFLILFSLASSRQSETSVTQ